MYQGTLVEEMPEDVSNQINKSAGRDVEASIGSKVYRNYQQCIYTSMSTHICVQTAHLTISVKEKAKEQHLKEKAKLPVQKILLKL